MKYVMCNIKVCPEMSSDKDSHKNHWVVLWFNHKHGIKIPNDEQTGFQWGVAVAKNHKVFFPQLQVSLQIIYCCNWFDISTTNPTVLGVTITAGFMVVSHLSRCHSTIMYYIWKPFALCNNGNN